MKEHLPNASYNLLFNEYVREGNQSLEPMDKALHLEEDTLVFEYKKSFQTYVYEHSVILLATLVVDALIPVVRELIDTNEEPQNLLAVFKHRHIGYAYFKKLAALDEEQKDTWETIRKYQIYGLTLYEGLLEFYKFYYGKFPDNELAIQLICSYYPEGCENNEALQGKVVEGLRSHIQNAGTPSDVGFAYNGISLIRSKIKGLPLYVIIAVIEDYPLFRVINEPICRNQILAAISGSGVTIEQKERLKFLYIDSLLIANAMNPLIARQYSKNEDLAIYYNNTSLKIGDEKIGVLKDKDQEEALQIKGYWSKSGDSKRVFWLYQPYNNFIDIYSIDYYASRKEIYIVDRQKPRNQISIPFDYEDYSLYYLNHRNSLKPIENFIDGNEISAKNNDEELTFSLVYLNEYRGIESQCIEIDHRFSFDPNENRVNAEEFDEKKNLTGFYGANIYSMTCIVGKNGTGKTSTIDFLRDTFFRLLELVNQNTIPIEEGRVDLKDYESYGLMDPRMDFLVVFRLNNIHYFITNLKKLSYENLVPFNQQIYLYPYELSKVIYFSNALSVCDQELFWDEDNAGKPDHFDDKQGMRKKHGQSLKDFRQKDYSERETFKRKHRCMDRRNPGNGALDLEKYINKELLYQLFFIVRIGWTTFCELLELDKDVTLSLVKKDKKISFLENGVLLFQELGIFSLYNEFLINPESYIGYFSAGQYAKLNLLSKLYWFLHGEDFVEAHKHRLSSNDFEQNEFLRDGESVLIFMDECELYMHPEWQRKLIDEWLRFINGAHLDNRIQLVMTTNSPFLLSDVLTEDVHYLPRDTDYKVGTFAQNIHRLLMKNFFMENTIGAYSKQMIEEIINSLTVGKDGKINFESLPIYKPDRNKKLDIPRMENFIKTIAEPIYQERLLELLYNTEEWQYYHERKGKEEEMRSLEKRLKELREETDDNTM